MPFAMELVVQQTNYWPTLTTPLQALCTTISERSPSRRLIFQALHFVEKPNLVFP
jgi:hypothetical protein